MGILYRLFGYKTKKEKYAEEALQIYADASKALAQHLVNCQACKTGEGIGKEFYVALGMCSQGVGLRIRLQSASLTLPFYV